MKSNTPILRPATVNDAALIADMHTASWQTTYSGLLPDAYLQHEIVHERRAYWPAKLASINDDGLLRIAEDEGGALGFVYAEWSGATAQAETQSRVLVDNLHVLPRGQGTGIGKALLAAVEAWARTRGAAELYLHALEGNQRAIDFYLRQGWQHYGTESSEVGGIPVTALNFRFPL